MGKKQVAVTLRKPPQADLDSFVSGKDMASAPVSTTFVKRSVTDAEFTASERAPEADDVVMLPGGRSLRELTVYLPADLARKLSLHCVEEDRDLNNVLAEILREHLEKPAVELPEPPPAPTTISEIVREILTSLWHNRPWAV
jgi:hypothetical protein